MVGVDEVGRGCLAGPLLVVAARPNGVFPAGLKDSKLLSRAQRETIYPVLLERFEFGEGYVSSVEIDRLGLAEGLRLGVKRALFDLRTQPDEEVILDGKVDYIPDEYTNGRCEVGADASHPVVSAASIVAKVRRDRFMAELAKKHPEFSFANHVGYGTRAHYSEISHHGPLKAVHRLSFAPFNTM